MSQFKKTLNPFTGKLQKILNGIFAFKGVVSDVASLPSSGNTEGDVYKVTGVVDTLYIWTDTSWKDLGGISSVSWGVITGTLSDQTDLQSALDEKIDDIVAIQENTKMLLHLDGSDGATSTVDSSGRHGTINFNGTAQLDTAFQKFGESSLLLDGNSDYLDLPSSSDWSMFENNTDSWTVDFWVKHADFSGVETYLSCYEDSSNNWDLLFVFGSIALEIESGGVPLFTMVPGGSISDSDWHHIAFVKVADIYAIYLDGVQVTYIQDSSTASFDGILKIGQAAEGGVYLDGHIDEIRIINSNPFSASPNVGKTNTITIPTSAHAVDTVFDEVAQIETDGTISRSGVNISDIADLKIGSINFLIDGGGSEITTGIVGDIRIPFDCEVLSATLLSDQSGSIKVDIWKDVYGSFPPTDADTITGGNEPEISSGIKYEDTTLTSWSKSISDGDTLRFNVDSVTTIERCTLILKIQRL